jgi:hypothetical protein
MTAVVPLETTALFRAGESDSGEIHMNNSKRVFLRTGAVATAAALLGGCVVAPVGPVPVAEGPVYAPSAPPPPQYEAIPAAPFVGAVWIGGFWNWSGGRYAWAPGHYARPRPGYHWQPRQWARNPRGGWEAHGGWQRSPNNGFRPSDR